MTLNKKSSDPKSPFTSVEQSILTTLVYADIFHFPLSHNELWNYLIAHKKIAKDMFAQSIKDLHKHIIYKDGYYALPDRMSIVNQRIQNREEVTKKTLIAKKVAGILSTLPSILFIGISGGLAVNNVTADDDIDLFIIVKKGTVFATRFWILIFLAILGKRRSRLQKNAANLICVNMLVDETSIVWTSGNRDIYTAHEIAQVKPLFEREHMYSQFLENNLWIQTYLPNVKALKLPVLSGQPQILVAISTFLIAVTPEKLLRSLQLVIMQRHRTNETIQNNHLAFHPRDYRAETLKQLKLKMRQLGLLTKF